jgi:hypothetical protein
MPVEQHALGTALPLDEQSLSVSDPPVSGNSSPEEDDLASSVQRLSIAETELRLVQRDMAWPGCWTFPRREDG